MKKQYLECGKVVSTHGVNGELKVQHWCDSPQDLVDIKKMYLDASGRTMLKTKARAHKNMVLVKVDGVDTIEQAQGYRGKILYLDRDDVKLSEGEYFIQDILGLNVVDADDGHSYGTVCEVTQTGANDVYHIAFPDGKVYLIPVIDEVVISTDMESRTLTIRPMKGLFDE
jgi:16S rRNA processing protein RimM